MSSSLCRCYRWNWIKSLSHRLWCYGRSANRVQWGFFSHVIAILPISSAVHIRPLTPFPMPYLPHSMPKDYLYGHSELFCLNIKTYSPPPPKKLALNCAVNYCLLLQETHICPSTRNVSTLHCRRQMGIYQWRNVFNTQHALPGAANTHVQPLVEKNVIGHIYLHCHSAGPLPGSRRRKDNNALSSPCF